MAWLACDVCGKKMDAQGSWDTPFKIICKECINKLKNKGKK